MDAKDSDMGGGGGNGRGYVCMYDQTCRASKTDKQIRPSVRPSVREE